MIFNFFVAPSLGPRGPCKGNPKADLPQGMDALQAHRRGGEKTNQRERVYLRLLAALGSLKLASGPKSPKVRAVFFFFFFFVFCCIYLYLCFVRVFF